MKYTIPIPWKNANGSDKYLVYCAIFCCPASHCSVSSSNFGITVPINCMIIDALIYGANPMAIKENPSIAQPKSIKKYPNPDPLASIVLLIKALTSINGTGMKTRSL